jgi:hypothetical protein
MMFHQEIIGVRPMPADPTHSPAIEVSASCFNILRRGGYYESHRPSSNVGHLSWRGTIAYLPHQQVLSTMRRLLLDLINRRATMLIKTRYHDTKYVETPKIAQTTLLEKKVAGEDCGWDFIEFRRISRITYLGFLDISTEIYAYEKKLRAPVRRKLSYLYLKRSLQDFTSKILPSLSSN